MEVEQWGSDTTVTEPLSEAKGSDNGSTCVNMRLFTLDFCFLQPGFLPTFLD